jgi:extracellular elastinolytic metalloproteinase
MTSPVQVTDKTMLRFWHQYNTEAYYDGGVVEIEVNGGAWTDLSPKMLEGDYNLVLATVGLNPLAGRNAFSGYSGGYVETVVDLGSYAGEMCAFAFA